MGNSDVVAAFGNTYVFYGKAAFYPAETSTWNPMERFAGKGSGNRRNLSIFSARDSVGGDDWNWKYHRDFHGDRDWRTGSDFLVLDHRCLRNRNLLCGVLFVSTFPGAKGRWILYWRTDVCDGACASSKSAAIVFALAVVLVSFGMGSSVQSHSIAVAVNEHWTIDPKVIGILLGIVILGGVDKITKVCTWLVPFMSCFFLGGCLFLVWKNRDVFLETIRLIVTSAFSARSAAGGVAGVTVMTGLRIGVARGLFTSEAGLGSIPISAAAAQTKSAYRQSLVSMTGVFWDTVVMCAVTGIAIIGCMIKEPARYLQAADDRLCFLAFENLPFRGSEMLSVSLVLFAFATIIGWSYYGERAVEYLGKGRGIRLYRILYIGSVLIGTILPLEAVWEMSDLFNSLMVLPNVFCLWMLKRYVEWKE